MEKNVIKKNRIFATMTLESLVRAHRETKHGAVTGDQARLVGFPADISWGWKDCRFCSLKGLSLI